MMMKSVLYLPVLLMASILISGYTHPAGGPEVSFNGTFIRNPQRQDWQAVSPNRVYSCRYQVAAVSDEYRLLQNFQFFENGRMLFTLSGRIPGSDLYISNSGFIAFIDLSRHFDRQTTLHFYSRDGEPLLSRTFRGGSHFQFSASGERFGLAADHQIITISLPGGEMKSYPNGYQFAFSDSGRILAIAGDGVIRIYQDDRTTEIHSAIRIPRKIAISEEMDRISIIDKHYLKIFSLSGEFISQDTVDGEYSFRDLTFSDGDLWAGIHHKSRSHSRGILRKYDPCGDQISEQAEQPRMLPLPPESPAPPGLFVPGDSIPWPFMPFDSMPEIWNHFEQHMGGYGPDYSYLHQGLDIITPIGEPTYAVEAGVVKCILTIGGASYWRLAISPQQTTGYSDGWLYAHLIENSIQVDVGDTVQLHDYLGDIIQWYANWGHIHFVQIRDSGRVWLYNDNEWGINFNPLLALRADRDTIPPLIQNVFPHSKFGFCINETSQYLDPDSLYGEVDIIVKVNDYCGFSGWTQPAFSLYYQISSLQTGEIILPRTLAQVLNHAYPFYSGSNYEPYATLLYKRDNILLPSSWMNTDRNYYHILTNNNGDSLAELSEKSLALVTTNHPDGWYRIRVEAYDAYNNCTIDSMDVRFKNFISHIPPEQTLANRFRLEQNHPNPFNPRTTITFHLPYRTAVTLQILDPLGREVQTLRDGVMADGWHQVIWDGEQFPGGIYFCHFRAGSFHQYRKMILLR